MKKQIRVYIATHTNHPGDDPCNVVGRPWSPGGIVLHVHLSGGDKLSTGFALFQAWRIETSLTPLQTVVLDHS